jgi:hypothetical protein
VYTLDDSGIILEVMDGAPSTWNTVLTTQSYRNVIEFQAAIRYHEDALMRLDKAERDSLYRERERDQDRERNRNRDYPTDNNARTARVNLVGWSANLGAPKFPKDDGNVSKRATPESKGARPCRHCGSGKHWDNECKHAYKGNRVARTSLASATSDDRNAQDDYDDLYYQLSSETDESSTEDEPRQDFELPLQTTEPPTHRVTSDLDDLRSNSALGGDIESETSSRDSDALENSHATACASFMSKPALNRRTRRRLAKEISARNYRVEHSSDIGGKSMIVLRKYMARPPGSAFLGASATEATATVNSMDTDPIKVIIDSGSDITLISRKTLEELTISPKLKAGHEVKLIQVTGKSSISGFVNLDLFFHTEDGPVKINVEAYVVNGMSTPFILGNDFADQYSISVIRENGATFVRFGDSGRQIAVESSTMPSMIDEDGHAFKVKTLHTIGDQSIPSRSIHRRNQKLKRKARLRRISSEVYATERAVIPAETSKTIPVTAHFLANCKGLFVERQIKTNGNADDLYGSADSYISGAEI